MIPSVYPEDLRQTGHPNRRLMTVTSSNPQAQRYPGPCISSLSKKKNILDHIHCYYHRYSLSVPKKASNVISRKFANGSISGGLFNPPYSCISHSPSVKHSII